MSHPYTLDQEEIGVLRKLAGTRLDQLVWDFNAVYLVHGDRAAKIGIDVAAVGNRGGPYFEDVHPLRVSASDPRPSFKEDGEARKLYRVVATDESITKFEIVRAAIRMPEYKVIGPVPDEKTEADVYVIDGGVLIHTPVGVLAAVPKFPFYGFRHETRRGRPVVELVEISEALKLLPEAYELIPIVPIAES